MNESKSYDAIVVLGHYCDSKGNLSRRQRSRALKAVQLLDKYPDAKVIVTGGKGKTFNRSSTSLAHHVKSCLQQLGVSSEEILLEDKSVDTAQQAVYVKELAHNHKFTSLVIVTSFPHIFRTKYIFDKAFNEDYNLHYITSDYWSGIFNTPWDCLWELAGWVKILVRVYNQIDDEDNVSFH